MRTSKLAVARTASDRWENLRDTVRVDGEDKRPAVLTGPLNACPTTREARRLLSRLKAASSQHERTYMMSPDRLYLRGPVAKATILCENWQALGAT
ncbi:MAG TPA: hypothetical protein VH025_09220 [Solirubrobacteraceae bacterium]|jgi:hypothetical protein|nr:hypothetical protein [Solirubrobacteraceae bacterium]